MVDVSVGLSLAVVLVCLGLFVWRRWAGLLFWSGAAIGGLLGQCYALRDAAGASWYVLASDGAIGAVLGMLAGGMLADWWQDRQDVLEVLDVVDVAEEPPAFTAAPGHPDLEDVWRDAPLADQELMVEAEDSPDLEVEAV